MNIFRDIPNTECRNRPVIVGLDPGTRSSPFSKWKPRDSLLKSCFCKEGHIRYSLLAFRSLNTGHNSPIYDEYQTQSAKVLTLP